MILNIKNYKCISEMNFDLNESKLNFIYGISGSGKTSISEIISTKLSGGNFSNECKKVDSNEDMEIKLDNTELNSVNVFNEDSIRDFIFDKKKDGLYEIIYQPTEELNILNEQIRSFVKEDKVKDIRNVLINFTHNFRQLQEKLNIKYTTKGKLSSNVTIKALDNDKSYSVNEKYNNSQIAWLNKGLVEFEKSKQCPFCEADISEERLEYISLLNNLKPDVINNILQNTIILDELKIKQITLNNKEDSGALKNELSALFSINEDVKKLLKMLDNNYSDTDNIEAIQIEDDTQEYFLTEFSIDINGELTELNQSKKDYLLLCKQYKGKFIANLDRNIANLNRELDKLHVPYKFEKTMKFDREEKYKIIHKNSSLKMDLSRELSTGEKNLISLALFLIVNEENNIIIDDPASSFDEYKRSKILKLINDMRSDNNKFTLVLSHDQIFLKFLLLDYADTWDSYIVESSNNEKLKKIESKDIDTILNHIKSNFKNCNSYERKIINLRMYYELNKDVTKNIYQYLSAILHGISVENLQAELSRKELDEEQIISKINSDTDIGLTNYVSCNLNDVYNEVSNFEKIFIKREVLTGNEKKLCNDVVHFNYGLIHMINPFIYDFQVKDVYNLL